jgi:hypothetical protein
VTKNQLSPPAFTMAPPVELASIQVSKVHCTVFGLHCGPVRSAVAAEVFRQTRFFSRATPETASATALFGTSTIMSTLSRSNHCRASCTPISGRFWWSATSTSTWKPAWPKSSIAWRVQATAVGPVMSR